MKTKVSVIYYFTILIVVLFVLSMLFTLLVISSNTISHNQMIKNDKEGFTNKIRETYRPYFRNLRLGTNNYYNKMKNKFLSFFRKLGLF